ncbi:hypothetical protein diail_604 [Diaporthe ilicicola]|nr:hypothetical protein diail_604 [Diaporthe ilicicola]
MRGICSLRLLYTLLAISTHPDLSPKRVEQPNFEAKDLWKPSDSYLRFSDYSIEIMAEQNQLASLLADSDPISDLNDRLPVAEPSDLEDFIAQCDGLLDINLHDHTDPQKRSIHLGGPRSRLYVSPFQLCEAWKMLNQRQRTGGLRGGLLSNAAGTGKSFIILTMAWLRARSFDSERQTAQGVGLRCPSQQGSDLVCYCVPTSKARALVDQGDTPRGVCLIQVSLALIGLWISIFEDAHISGCNICVVHSDLKASSHLRRDFATITKSLSRPPAKNSASPETYIFVSSHGNSKVLETFSQGDFNVGMLFNDESHQAMRLESRSMAIAEAQSRIGPQGLDLWLVSATPIRNLADWELPMSIWCGSHDLARAAAVKDLITAHATARSSTEDMQDFLALWAQVFDHNLVKRNLAASHFCGRPITDIQSVTPNTVFLTTPARYLPDVQEIADLARETIRSEARHAAWEKIPYKPEYASGLDARLHFTSLFPRAAVPILRGKLNVYEESIRSTIAAIKDPNKLKVERSAKFQQDLDEIVNDSPKLDFILAEIQRMRDDKDRRPADPALPANSHGENLSMKKMLIITPTLGTAVYLYLILRERVPDLGPVLLHSLARASDREAALNSFTSLTARKTARHSCVLITPFSTGGTGLNLQSANYEILVSPLSSRASEVQCFARTNRAGQRLRLHHNRLICADHPADRINVASYAGRSVLNDPFAMDRQLVLSEPDGSKRIQRLQDWGYTVRDADHKSIRHDVNDLLFGGGEFRGYDIFPQGKGMVDQLIVFDSDSAARDVLAVNAAWNTGDQRPKHEKLPLRDILLAVWVHHLNRSVHDLRHLVYFNVVQEDLNDDLRPEVYELMGEDMKDNLVVHSQGEAPGEAEAFSLLLEKAPFCIGAQKMLEEYPEFSEVEIVSFEFLPIVLEFGDYLDNEPPYFDFRINFE